MSAGSSAAGGVVVVASTYTILSPPQAAKKIIGRRIVFFIVVSLRCSVVQPSYTCDRQNPRHTCAFCATSRRAPTSTSEMTFFRRSCTALCDSVSLARFRRAFERHLLLPCDLFAFLEFFCRVMSFIPRQGSSNGVDNPAARA